MTNAKQWHTHTNAAIYNFLFLHDEAQADPWWIPAGTLAGPWPILCWSLARMSLCVFTAESRHALREASDWELTGNWLGTDWQPAGS